MGAPAPPPTPRPPTLTPSDQGRFAPLTRWPAASLDSRLRCGPVLVMPERAKLALPARSTKTKEKPKQNAERFGDSSAGKDARTPPASSGKQESAFKRGVREPSSGGCKPEPHKFLI